MTIGIDIGHTDYMALSLNEIKIRAQQFVLNWKDKAATAREEADAQTFENEFFAIFGVPRNQQPRRKRRGTVLNVSHCVFYKVVAVGFNTLCYDASVGVLNPPHE